MTQARPGPPTGGAPPAPDAPRSGPRREPRRVSGRDLTAVAVMVAGSLGLMVCLYLIHPLAAASAVCLWVIACGALVGLYDPKEGP